MEGKTILYDNLYAVNMSEEDLMAKLREANVVEFSEVKAVVLETTGDVTVLHSSGSENIEEKLLNNVRRKP